MRQTAVRFAKEFCNDIRSAKRICALFEHDALSIIAKPHAVTVFPALTIGPGEPVLPSFSTRTDIYTVLPLSPKSKLITSFFRFVPDPVTVVCRVVGAAGDVGEFEPQFVAAEEVSLYRYLHRGDSSGGGGGVGDCEAQGDEVGVGEGRGEEIPPFEVPHEGDEGVKGSSAS
jgi:hypothetical protein